MTLTIKLFILDKEKRYTGCRVNQPETVCPPEMELVCYVLEVSVNTFTHLHPYTLCEIKCL